MALCIVDSDDAELPCVLWLIAPKELDVAGITPVSLFLLESFDVLHTETEIALMPLGGVNAFVGLQFPGDVLKSFVLVVSQPRGVVAGFWWGATPVELVDVLDSGNSQVREIAPLHVVVDDPDLLWVLDG